MSTRDPDKFIPRAARMHRAIRQLEHARKNLEAAYRAGEFAGTDSPLAALEVALDRTDRVLDLMTAAIEAQQRRNT